MSKQRADNGIDYTPKRPKSERQMERHIHGVVQRQQHYPIFEVKAGGKTVEWTDHRLDGHNAFVKADTLPKQLCMVHEDGRRVLLDEVSQVGRTTQLAQAA
jgi:hypothetical protein